MVVVYMDTVVFPFTHDLTTPFFSKSYLYFRRLMRHKFIITKSLITRIHGCGVHGLCI